MFEARMAQGNLLRKVIEAIKDLVTDANFDCTKTEFNLQAMDSSHVSLVALALKSDGFDHYRCDKPISMGAAPVSVRDPGWVASTAAAARSTQDQHAKSSCRLERPCPWCHRVRVVGRNRARPGAACEGALVAFEPSDAVGSSCPLVQASTLPACSKCSSARATTIASPSPRKTVWTR